MLQILKKIGGLYFSSAWQMKMQQPLEQSFSPHNTRTNKEWLAATCSRKKLILSLDHCSYEIPGVYKYNASENLIENLQVLLIVYQKIEISNPGYFNEDIFHFPRQLFPFQAYSQVC